LIAPRGDASITALRTFSKIRGAPHMNSGLTSPSPATILSTRPSTAELNPIAICVAMRAFPKTCDNGSHRYWT